MNILRASGIIHIAVLLLAGSVSAGAQRLEKVPFGDFEQWTVRYIKESSLIGGQTRKLYVVAPRDTIRANAPYDYSRTIWSSSNAYAVVMGITKTSCSVTPADGPTGKCARLETCYAACKVAGVLNIKVLVQGTLIWGRMKEPVTGISDPYSSMDWGIPFTGRPKAILLDYRATIPDTGTMTRGTTFKTETFPGHDAAEVTLLLQHRWEDEQGNIHAERVGTAMYRIGKSSNGWVKKKRIPVIYGNATEDPGYKPFMDLLCNTRPLTAINSKGKSKVIKEEAWAAPDAEVTHAILIISSGSSGAFVGAIGDVLDVDNVILEY